MNIFISHAWKYGEHYNKVVKWLDDSGIEYRNCSIPEEKALNRVSKKKLEEKLDNQIRSASVVVILAGMYVSYSDWIEYEINRAVDMKKYIIAVEPWGQERIPDIVNKKANVKVKWQSKPFIQEIQKHGNIHN